MKSVIMAGGKGTRLLSMTRDQIPKPMMDVCGKPILQWQIEALVKNGITDICIVTGHLGHVIQAYFKDGGKFSANIQYFQEQTPMGTAGALAHLGYFLDKNPLLLVFGDTIFDIDIPRMERFHLEKNAAATLLVHPNSHPFDSDLAVLDDSGRMTGFDSKHNKRDDWYNNCVNAGFYILDPGFCPKIPQSGKLDLEKDVLTSLIQEGAVYGYLSSEYIKDVGTVERIKQAEADLTAGIVSSKNLSHKQKCIFLDRDGTINKENGLIYTPEGLELEPLAAEAIGLINRSSYLSIIVTNQPVVARGLCGIEDVELIHKKMQTLLGRQGAYLDSIQYCPHHPDKGYPEENPDYKIPCGCRKPGIDMLLRSANQFNIDLSQSWMIGDTTRDIKTGKNAGTKTALVKTGLSGSDGLFSETPDLICENLLEAVKIIIKGEIK